MLRPLSEWDDAYLDEVDATEESGELEKKGSAGLKRATIAKQVCAFANAGGGFVVFGLKDRKAGGGLDKGVNEVGNTTIKALELIPKLHEPAILGCEALFIRRNGHHQRGKGVLVLAIPSSVRRPHWVKSPREPAYLRVGKHSWPMLRRTFLDIASRSDAPQAEIISLGKSGQPSQQDHCTVWQINPIVRTLTGPVCKEWAFELSIPEAAGILEASSPNVVKESKWKILALGTHHVELFSSQHEFLETPASQSFLRSRGRDRETFRRCSAAR
jgi:hypothetical protein